MPKLSVGDPPSFSCRDHNRAQDAADWVALQQTVSAPPSRPPRAQENLVIVRNATAAVRAQFDVVELGSWLFAGGNPARNDAGFSAITPADVTRPLAVLLQPLACGGSGALGPAQISGVTKARVNVSSVLHPRAYPVANSHELQSGFAGPAQLLYVPGTGSQLCVVVLDGGSAVELEVVTQESGIDAGTYANGRVTPAVGTCDVWTDESVPWLDGETQLTLAVRNYGPAPIDAGKFLHCVSGRNWQFRAIVEFCDRGWA